jgi:hypothetical protein
VMAFHGTHGRGTQGSDADPANDVPTRLLRVHNDHYATENAALIESKKVIYQQKSSSYVTVDLLRPIVRTRGSWGHDRDRVLK